jgi:hypothetical protein
MSDAPPKAASGVTDAQDPDELSLRRKDVPVDPNAEEAEVAKVLRAAFPPLEAYLFRWLDSERGTEVVKTVTDLIKSAKRVTLDRLAEEKRQTHRREMLDRIGRYVMMALILGLGTYLRVNDKLDTVIFGLLSASLGFLFGRQTAHN